MQSAVPLFILGAAFGKTNVTQQLRGLADRGNGYLQVKADTATFGDGQMNCYKSLVIVYQHGQGAPQTLVTKEGEFASISPPQNPTLHTTGPPRAFLQVLGAAYGLNSVTERVTPKVKDYSLDVTADNNTFGDTWPGNVVTFVLVYHDANGTPNTVIAEEDQRVIIQPSWGSKPGVQILNKVVEQPVQPVMQQQQQQQPQNMGITITIGGGGNQQVTIGTGGQQQHQQQQPIQHNELVLAAVWGKKNVTGRVNTIVRGGNYTIEATNNNLGDGWPGETKTMTIVYQYPGYRPETLVCREGEVINIPKQGNPINQGYNPTHGLEILGATYGPAVVTHIVAQRVNNNRLDIEASNNNFGDAFPGESKILVCCYRNNFGIQCGMIEEGKQLRVASM